MRERVGASDIVDDIGVALSLLVVLSKSRIVALALWGRC